MSEIEHPTAAAWDRETAAPSLWSRWRGIGLSLVVTGVLTGVLFLRLDVEAFRDGLDRVDAWVLVAVVGFHGLSWGVRALRWRALLASVCPVPAASLFRLVMIGAMISSVIPARAGEFWRAHALGREAGLSRSTVFGTIFVERVMDGLAVALLAAGAGLAIGPSGALTLLIVGAIVLFLGSFALLAMYVNSAALRASCLRLATAMTPRRFRPLMTAQLELFNAGLDCMRTTRTLAGVLALSFLVCGVDAIGYWLLGRGFGFDIEPLAYLLVVAVGNLAVALPLSIAGIGPFEFFVRQSLTSMGIGSAVALAYALLLHALTLVFVSLAGLASLWSNLARPSRRKAS